MHSWCESEHFHVLVSRFPSLNDCMVSKQNVLVRSPALIFVQILSYSFNCGLINEDNYCHSQQIGQLIKEKFLKGIFKDNWLINVAANTQISPSLLLTSAICKQTINFFLHECFLEFFFFPEITLECWGCGLYTSLYGTWHLFYCSVFSNIFDCNHFFWQLPHDCSTWSRKLRVANKWLHNLTLAL